MSSHHGKCCPYGAPVVGLEDRRAGQEAPNVLESTALQPLLGFLCPLALLQGLCASRNLPCLLSPLQVCKAVLNKGK